MVNIKKLILFKSIIVIAIFISLYFTHKGQTNPTVRANDPIIYYIGRIRIEDTTTIVSWSGTQIIIRFKGTELKVSLHDEKGENYYQIIIDQDSSFIFHPKQGYQTYRVLKNLKDTIHKVIIFKRTEYIFGRTKFFSFSVNKTGNFLPYSHPQRLKIEFYGNSITAGLGNEHPTGSSMNSKYENNYLAYGAISARSLNADYVCIARSGIGLTISWDSLIMPELFWRVDPYDSTIKWNFKNYQADIVVINLFQNDSWLVKMPFHAQYKRRFKQKPKDEFFIQNYYNFVDTLLKLYPYAQIICTLGPMSAIAPNSKWKDYILEATEKLNNSRIHTLFFPYFSKHGHPTIEEHKKMATILVEYIKMNYKRQKTKRANNGSF